MRVIRDTEEKCKNTYANIKKKLDKLNELNESSAALRRLIKRNQKRDKKLERGDRKTQSHESSSGAESEYSAAKGVRCKLPFVVAVYKPDPDAIPSYSKGK